MSKLKRPLTPADREVIARRLQDILNEDSNAAYKREVLDSTDKRLQNHVVSDCD